MDNGIGMMIILGACAVVLLIGGMRRKMEWLLNITLRGVLGTVGMYFVNAALSAAGISLGVGINAVTILTCAILGFPGFLGLYGLGIYKLL